MIQQYSVEQNSINTAPETEAEPEKESGSVVELLERIGSVVLPVGVALYAVLYIGVEEIYGVFGVSPQQAGIDQAVLFGRLSGALVLLLMVGIPALGLIVGLLWLLNKITAGAVAWVARAVRRRPWVAALVAALWSGATYWGFVSVFAELDLVVMVIIAVGLGVLTFLIPFRLLRRKPVGRAGMKLLVGALTGLGLGFLLIIQLLTSAVDAHQTGRSNLLLDAVGFQNQWTVLNNPEDGKPLYDGRRMMLLGESEGTYVLYDCDKGETIRRPIEATGLGALELDPEQPEGYACGSLAEEE
ncbi:hypothetical protein [Sphaerisporangium aureirubrum]|uniref:Yip1 domain-containing protein n=1 Tax=Sphaerisporangium aureirubrum TaxID=1544736 RepID=A0ABW1N8P2_9ACTN